MFSKTFLLCIIQQREMKFLSEIFFIFIETREKYSFKKNIFTRKMKDFIKKLHTYFNVGMMNETISLSSSFDKPEIL